MRQILWAFVLMLGLTSAHAADLMGGPDNHPDLAHSAARLKTMTEAVRDTGVSADYAAQIAALAEQAARVSAQHRQMPEGADTACILDGISRDLPERLRTLTEARTPQAQDEALKDMTRVLDDTEMAAR